MYRCVKLKKKIGLTLLEIILSVSIFALVAITISTIFNQSLFVYRRSTDKSSAAQQAQTAMEWLVRDIESAPAIVVAVVAGSSLELVDAAGSYIQYSFNSTLGEIRRQDCTGQNYLLAEDATQLSFRYYDIHNDRVNDPINDLLSFKTVQIDLTIQKNNQRFQLNSVARFEFDPDFSWIKTYGGSSAETVNRMYQTPDGGYVIGGRTASFGAGANENMLLIKTDPSLASVWAKTYGGPGVDFLNSLSEDLNGNFILAGQTNSFGASNDGILVEATPAGIINWAKTYGGINTDYFNSAQKISGGGFILAGASQSFGSSEDGLLIKTDSQGAVVWSKTYGGPNTDTFKVVREISQGRFILAGETQSFGAGSRDVFLMEIDSAGNVNWASAYGGAYRDYLFSLEQTSDGGFLLAGYTDSFGGSDEALLIKTFSNGQVEWTRTYGGAAGQEYGEYAIPTSDGGYLLVGTTKGSFVANYWDAMLVKIDSAYNITGLKTFGGLSSHESVYSAQETPDGGYILGGNGSGAGRDFILIKTNSSGDVGCCNIAYSQNISAFTVGVPSLISNSFTPTVTNVTLTTQTQTLTETTVTPTLNHLCPSA